MRWDQSSRENRWQMVAGVLILALGVIHLLNNFNVINAGPIATRWWPAIFIVIGIRFIFVRPGTNGWVTGLFWIGTGGLFLLTTLGYLQVGFPKLIWPIMLIWFGLSMFLGLPRCGSQSVNRSRS